jgi:prepilin-type N-terminal cleavage/methylation domain-containing protein
MNFRVRNRSGVSVVELLIVLAIVGVLAGMVVSASTPSLSDQLESAAQIIATDVGYARSLAVTNGSRYRLTFDFGANHYTLTHTGTNAALDTLPPNPFRRGGDAANVYRVDLDELPQLGVAVHLFGVRTRSSPVQATTFVEFGPLGETTSAEATVIWLMAGEHGTRRYMPIEINPVTGLTEIGPLRTATPPSAGATSDT